LAPEPSRGAGLVAALGVLVALGAAVSLTEFFVAPGYRQTAIRLISALVLLVALARVRPIVAAAVERRVAWGDEIRFSVRSQSYFEHLLWPRLVALARARGGSPEAEKPSGRRFGRGPSVTALARLIGSLETRR